MRSSILGRASAVAASAALVIGLSACAAANEQASGGQGSGGSQLSGTIEGAGASSQDAAQQAWQAGFLSKHPDVTVNYAPIGSGGGRERFINGASDFGGTDTALTDEEIRAAKKRCGQVVELPTYISPIAVAHNIQTPSGKKIKNLNLTPETLAKIFNGKIERWSAPQIAKTNPDVTLPDTRITPVHRSDESGTTENFTDYLSVAAGEQAWPHEVSGNWPIQGGEAAKGTAGVKRAIGAGKGTIGYLDASQVGQLGTTSVKVGDEFVSYSPQAAAKVVEVSERKKQGKYVFAYDLARDTSESGAYPIVLVSYGLACTDYADPEAAKLVEEYFSYIISEQGQQQSAEAAGSAPISDKLRKDLEPAVKAISKASS